MKFKVRSLEFVVRSILIFILLLTVHLSLSTASEKWPGVDESVIEKVAKEHGREAREPFINTDQGDLLLFIFLLAGVVGGFIGGYYWRALTEKKVVRAEVLKKDV
jgi:ABC-type cobalt transport system substrate-binding protein